MYAIIETGGKQLKVTEGCTIRIEKLAAQPGSSYTFENVMAIVDGKKASFGAPYVKGAAVTATVKSQGRDKKVIVYKYKPKKGFHKKKGHRQPFTELVIDKIGAAEKQEQE